jgi:hypothetical protein
MATAINIEASDLIPADMYNKTSDWASDKPRYFCEALANMSFYLSKIPQFTIPYFGYVYDGSKSFVDAGKQLGNCKTFLAVPSAVKGMVGLYENLQKGGMKARNLTGDVAALVGDSLDSLKGINLFICDNCKQTEEQGVFYKIFNKAGVFKDIFDRMDLIKNIAGTVGLVNSIYSNNIELANLRKIDANKNVGSVANQDKAVEVKKNWVQAEIGSRWHDRLKNVTGLAMCTLSLSAITAGLVVSPWIFAVIGTAGLAGKFLTYSHKMDANFWHTRYAEMVLPASS